MVMRIHLAFNTCPCLDNGVCHSILVDGLNMNPIPGALVPGWSNSMKETAGSATTRMLS
jgi:hypothetical protein